MTHFTTLTNAAAILVVLSAAGCGDSTAHLRQTPTIAVEPLVIAGGLDGTSGEPGPATTLLSPGEQARGRELEASATETATAELASAPQAAQAAPAEPTTTAAPAPLELLDIVMARGVERFRPVGAAERFTTDGQPLYAYMQIANSSGDEQRVVITYEREDGLRVGPAQLSIPARSRGFRTFTRTSWLRQPGLWTVSVHSSAGELLGSTQFVIES